MTSPSGMHSFSDIPDASFTIEREITDGMFSGQSSSQNFVIGAVQDEPIDYSKKRKLEYAAELLYSGFIPSTSGDARSKDIRYEPIPSTSRAVSPKYSKYSEPIPSTSRVVRPKDCSDTNPQPSTSRSARPKDSSDTNPKPSTSRGATPKNSRNNNPRLSTSKGVRPEGRETADMQKETRYPFHDHKLPTFEYEPSLLSYLDQLARIRAIYERCMPIHMVNEYLLQQRLVYANLLGLGSYMSPHHSAIASYMSPHHSANASYMSPQYMSQTSSYDVSQQIPTTTASSSSGMSLADGAISFPPGFNHSTLFQGQTLSEAVPLISQSSKDDDIETPNGQNSPSSQPDISDQEHPFTPTDILLKLFQNTEGKFMSEFFPYYKYDHDIDFMALISTSTGLPNITGTSDELDLNQMSIRKYFNFRKSWIEKQQRESKVSIDSSCTQNEGSAKKRKKSNKSTKTVNKIELLGAEEEVRLQEAVEPEGAVGGFPCEGAVKEKSDDVNGKCGKSQDSEDEAYKEIRRKNNESAKRSRDRKREKIEETLIRKEFVAAEKKELRDSMNAYFEKYPEFFKTFLNVYKGLQERKD